jgi:hypothetical protein
MGFDRSQFKATQVSTLKEQEKQNASPRVNNMDGRVPFHTFQEGTSKWRIMPSHPGAKSFMAAKQVHWLPQEVKYQKDGKDIVEIKRRPVFNSITHAGTSKDIVQEYITFVTKRIYDATQDPEDRKQKLHNLTNWKVGVKGRTTWIVYAQLIEGKSRTLGRLELPGLVKDKMNELAITEDQSDDVIQTDPFTHPDTGKAILITYDRSQKDPSKKYSCNLEWRGDYSLSDNELEELMNADSLEDIYKDSYKRSDFEKALNGLRIFDEESGYNAFADDHWLDICENLDSMYPEDEDEEDAPKPAKSEVKKQVATSNEEEEEEEEDNAGLPWSELDELDRDGLKQYIKNKNLSIRVLKKYSDDDLREMIGEAEDEPQSHEESPSPASGTDRLADMKARLASKN